MQALTVEELIQELEMLRDAGYGDKPVHFTYNYGDHWNTTVAPVAERVEVGYVKYSDYHNMPKETEDEDDDEVVLIS